MFAHAKIVVVLTCKFDLMIVAHARDTRLGAAAVPREMQSYRCNVRSRSTMEGSDTQGNIQFCEICYRNT